MIRHAVSPRRLNWLSAACQLAERRYRFDVVLLGERVEAGEVRIEDGLLGIPYMPPRVDLVPDGYRAAVVTTDQLRVWLRDRGVE